MRALAFILLAACVPPQVFDAGPYAVAASDATAFLTGCGQRVAVGYLYCRFAEGWEPTGDIVVTVPPAQCGEPVCANVAIYGPDAAKVVDVGVPAGAISVAVPWKDLVGASPLVVSRRGFWPVLVRFRFLRDGLVEQAMVEGEIRIRVLRGDYRPLGAGDPATWTWTAGDLTFGMTDKGRARVSNGHR